MSPYYYVAATQQFMPPMPYNMNAFSASTSKCFFQGALLNDNADFHNRPGGVHAGGALTADVPMMRSACLLDRVQLARKETRNAAASSSVAGSLALLQQNAVAWIRLSPSCCCAVYTQALYISSACDPDTWCIPPCTPVPISCCNILLSRKPSCLHAHSAMILSF